MLHGTPELILADINQSALEFRAVNAVLNDLSNSQMVFSDVLDAVEGEIGLPGRNNGRDIWRSTSTECGELMDVRLVPSKCGFCGVARLALRDQWTFTLTRANALVQT